MTDLEHIEQLARGAIKPLWFTGKNYEQARIDFIAAANPATVIELVERIRAAEDERDAAIAECRKRRGWDQDIAHWQERAELAESELKQLKGSKL
ncbi:hypothetical protein CCP3SC15_1610004 [Gammaproteobacteria bacterium]